MTLPGSGLMYRVQSFLEDHAADVEPTFSAVDAQATNGVVYAKQFDGATLAEKVENAHTYLSDNADGRGKIRVTAPEGGGQWEWGKDVTIDLMDWNGVHLDIDRHVEINYPNDGWPLTLDGGAFFDGETMKARQDRRSVIEGGIWTNDNGDANGWLRCQDAYGTTIDPQNVEFTNSSGDCIAVLLQNVDGFTENLELSGFYDTNIGIKSEDSGVTGGSGTNSFHDCHFDAPQVNATDRCIHLTGQWQMCHFDKPAMFAAGDGATLLTLDGNGAGQYDGLTITSAKFEDATGGTHANTTGIEQTTDANANLTPLLVNPRFLNLDTNGDIKSTGSLTMVNSRQGNTQIQTLDGTDVVVAQGDQKVLFKTVRVQPFDGLKSNRDSGNLDLDGADGWDSGDVRLRDQNGTIRFAASGDSPSAWVEAADLSGLAPGSDEDGKLFHHDGSNSINADGGTTSEPGYYVWSNGDDEFKSAVQY